MECQIESLEPTHMTIKDTKTKKPAKKKLVKKLAKRAAPPKEQVKGRPSDYTPELAFEICALIAEGSTLKEVAAKTGAGRRTILDWLDQHAEFAHQYARAREMQGDSDADEVKHVMRRVIDPETPADDRLDAHQARVAIDALKWSAGKRAPKKYGDRIVQELTGKGGEALKGPADTLATARWIADILTSGGQVAALQRKDDDDEDGDKRIH